jgi:hypothetical protein
MKTGYEKTHPDYLVAGTVEVETFERRRRITNRAR